MEKAPIPEHLQALLDRLEEHCRVDPDQPVDEQTLGQIDIDGVLQAAVGMADKMQLSRNNGRFGWHDPAACHIRSLMDSMLGHIRKGDLVDVMNLAMMVWLRQDIDKLDDEVFKLGLETASEVWASRVCDNRIDQMQKIFDDSLAEEKALLKQAQTGALGLPNPVTVEAIRAANQVINDYLKTVLEHISCSLPEDVDLRVEPLALPDSGRRVAVNLALQIKGPRRG